jgi:hypothetical protein
MRLAPALWFKNLFVPMYGQHDLQGRFTSFLIRFANGIIRSFLMFLWIWIVAILPIVWIIFPFAVTFLFINSLGFGL